MKPQQHALESPSALTEQPQGDPHVTRGTCDLLRQVDICAYLGITADTWISWRKAGLTPEAVVYPSGRLRWRRADIEALITGKVLAPHVEDGRPRRRYFKSLSRHAEKNAMKLVGSQR